MSPPVTASDITFMDSAKIAALVAAGIAELAARGEIALLDKAQAERLADDRREL
jgi:hypothetical protein